MQKNQAEIEYILLWFLYTINISQMSHNGYSMITLFNKYLLRAYYVPNYKLRECVSHSPDNMFVAHF